MLGVEWLKRKKEEGANKSNKGTMALKINWWYVNTGGW